MLYRLAYGVSTRLQRISPYQALQYGDYTIPPGVSFLHTPATKASVLMKNVIDRRWHDLLHHPPQRIHLPGLTQIRTRTLA